MTIPEVIDLLAKRAHETDWQYVSLGTQWRLRTRDGLCPLEFLAEGQAVYLADCYTVLALAHAEGDRLVDAADDNHVHEPALRRMLVRAVGVEESHG